MKNFARSLTIVALVVMMMMTLCQIETADAKPSDSKSKDSDSNSSEDHDQGEDPTKDLNKNQPGDVNPSKKQEEDEDKTIARSKRAIKTTYKGDVCYIVTDCMKKCKDQRKKNGFCFPTGGFFYSFTCGAWNQVCTCV